MAETLRDWVRRAGRDRGLRAGPAGEERGRIRELEREVREPRQADQILRKPQTAQGRFPRVQIVTVAELLSGRRPAMPQPIEVAAFHRPLRPARPQKIAEPEPQLSLALPFSGGKAKRRRDGVEQHPSGRVLAVDGSRRLRRLHESIGGTRARGTYAGQARRGGHDEQDRAFIKKARELGCDEDPAAFDRLFSRFVPPKRKPQDRPEGERRNERGRKPVPAKRD